VILVENISKIHRRNDGAPVHALRNVSISISAGEFVTIRGASGSGKSSLLNILGCLDRPTGGSYRLAGEDVSSYSDRSLARIRNQKIGFVFQAFQLLPRTTAVENVEIPMVYSGSRVDRRRALQALERVGLGARARHFAAELSGGEQQRVAIARALINDPALVLADEPTGNLDFAASSEIMRIFKELHADGRTIVMVTHDESIAAHARRQILLSDGAVIEDAAICAEERWQ
jgi:putative ABC transport system ATP-binding protein